MEDAARQAVPGAGRLAGRLPPAARLAAVGRRRSDVSRIVVPVDPIGGRAGRCPIPQPVAQARSAAMRAADDRAGSRRDRAELGDGAVGAHRARRVEPRDGRLCVFMPPVEALEDYLELVAAAEATARRAEAAGPHRGLSRRRTIRASTCIRVTPDPGVIEVNIHPAAIWRECVDDHHGVYEEARQSRLGADKFMIDGRHTGTGGGNHVVVGGATPDDSPFLRRPGSAEEPRAALAAPSVAVLSVLGPVHRPDQPGAAHRRGAARRALRAGDRAGAGAAAGQGEAPPPWLVDRLFRNLLVDVTGNTHRSEICIDKLFSPDGPTGRLGLVEFRGFEMPPDARMSLAQQLLMRALIARLWREPQTGRWCAGARRCTTASCCRILSGQDFLDVLGDLAAHGFAFEPGWFEAQREFRFPFCGEVEHGGVDLELRQALEPWHVMGEERRDRRHGALCQFARSSGCRSRSTGSIPSAMSSPATAGARAAGDHRQAARPSPACASRRGSRRPACTRRSRCTRR